MVNKLFEGYFPVESLDKLQTLLSILYTQCRTYEYREGEPASGNGEKGTTDLYCQLPRGSKNESTHIPLRATLSGDAAIAGFKALSGLGRSLFVQQSLNDWEAKGQGLA